MSQYKDIDEQLIAGIHAGRHSFTELWGAVFREAGRLSELTGAESFRIVDRRLQAMRKAGKIAYSHKTGWAVVTA